MSAVILVIHLMVAISLVGVVLLQRSEGGALGMGGGGGGGGFMSSRGAGNLLTRITTGLAVVFFLTSIGLSILARSTREPTSILDGVAVPAGEQGTERPVTPVLPDLPTQGDKPAAPQAPISQ